MPEHRNRSFDLMRLALIASLALVGCAQPPSSTNADAERAIEAREFRVARAHLAQMFEEGAADPQTYRLQMELMLEMGDGYSAMAAIENLSPSDLPPGERRVATARALLLQGKPDQAAALFDDIETENLTEADFYVALIAVKDLDEEDEFEAGMDLALDTFPDSAPLNALAAQKLIDLDLPEEAAPFAERALATDPKHYETHLVLGQIAIANDDLQTALERYQDANAIKPEKPMPLAAIAGLQLDLERYDEAGKTLDRALAQHPEMPFLIWQKARHALATGDLETTRFTVERARRSFRGNDEFTLFSAQVEEALGNRILALSEYRRYLRAVGEDAAISEHISQLENQQERESAGPG